MQLPISSVLTICQPIDRGRQTMEEFSDSAHNILATIFPSHNAGQDAEITAGNLTCTTRARDCCTRHFDPCVEYRLLAFSLCEGQMIDLTMSCND